MQRLTIFTAVLAMLTLGFLVPSPAPGVGATELCAAPLPQESDGDCRSTDHDCGGQTTGGAPSPPGLPDPPCSNAVAVVVGTACGWMGWAAYLNPACWIWKWQCGPYQNRPLPPGTP